MQPGEELLIPPDGGWGWMVVLGSWLINLLIFGLFRAGGIVLSESTDRFQCSRSTATWILVLNTGLAFFLAPVSGLLVRRFSYRQVVFVGGLACFVGLSISHFASDVYQIIIGYGVVMGCGFGLALSPNLSIVGLYFKRRRALATGLSFSGGAVGVFVMGPLLELCIYNYTLRGTFLILAAILLHICVAATLFHPIEYHLIPNFPNRHSGNGHLKVTYGRPIPTIELEPAKEDVTTTQFEKELDPNGNLERGDRLCNGYCSSTTPAELVPLACLDDEFILDESSVETVARLSLTIAQGPIISIPKILVTSADGKAVSVSLGSELTSTTTTTAKTGNQWWRDLVLIKSEVLLLVSLGYGTALAVYVGVTIMLPEYVEKELRGEFTRLDGYFCVVIAAVGDLAGRLCIGWFIDRLGKKKRYLYHLCLFAMSLNVLFLPLIRSYYLLLIVCCAIGTLYGICLVHSPCFLAEYLGITRLPWTMGLMLTLAGIPVLSLQPVIGVIKEQTGSYVASFLSLGSMLLFCSICWFLLPWFVQRHNERCKLEAENEQKTAV